MEIFEQNLNKTISRFICYPFLQRHVVANLSANVCAQNTWKKLIINIKKRRNAKKFLKFVGYVQKQF